MAIQIDHIERIESAVVFDIARSQKVRLVDIVEGQCLCEIRILNPLGTIGTFF